MKNFNNCSYCHSEIEIYRNFIKIIIFLIGEWVDDVFLICTYYIV